MKFLVYSSSALSIVCMIACAIIYEDNYKSDFTQGKTETTASLALRPPTCATSLPLAFRLLWEKSHYKRQVGLELLIFLSQPPKCWCHGPVPPCLVPLGFWEQSQSFPFFENLFPITVLPDRCEEDFFLSPNPTDILRDRGSEFSLFSPKGFYSSASLTHQTIIILQFFLQFISWNALPKQWGHIPKF